MMMPATLDASLVQESFEEDRLDGGSRENVAISLRARSLKAQ